MRGGLLTYQFVSRRQMLVLLPAIGLIIGGLAIAFSQITGKSVDEVLFSGQDQLPGLIGQAGTWSLAALAWLIVFKGLAYLPVARQLPRRPDVPGAVPRGRRGDHVLASPGLPAIGSRAGRHGRRDRRRAPAAALSGRARDAADVARRTQGRAADHRRRRRRIRRDARHGTPAGIGVRTNISIYPCACAELGSLTLGLDRPGFPRAAARPVASCVERGVGQRKAQPGQGEVQAHPSSHVRGDRFAPTNNKPARVSINHPGEPHGGSMTRGALAAKIVRDRGIGATAEVPSIADPLPERGAKVATR